MILTKLLGILGILVIIVLVWFMSDDKKHFPFRIVLWGLALQFVIAFFILNVPIGITFFQFLSDKIRIFLNYSMESAEFLFGNLVSDEHQSTFGVQIGIVIAVTVIFFSSFVSLLYHYGIMQRIVYAMAWIMQKTMKTSGIESLSAAGNIFIGQTEAPLMVRHYLGDASKSEINSIMVGGFATIAGGVMAAYISMGISPAVLITASLISAPGGLMLSKIAIPPTKKPDDLKGLLDVSSIETKNALDALSAGAGDGMKLALNILAMLIAFIAIIAFVDAIMFEIHGWLTHIGIDFFPRSLKELLGYVFMPFAYLTGIPHEEAHVFGSLVGTKVSINEFIAFVDLSEMIQSGAISDRTARIATFALCGFANLSSIAIQIGGLGALVPEKRALLASLGLRAMLIGALTNLLTATIASLLI